MIKDHEFVYGPDMDQYVCKKCNANAWINFELCRKFNKFIKSKGVKPGAYPARVISGKRIYITHRKTGRRMGVVPCISNNDFLTKEIIE